MALKPIDYVILLIAGAIAVYIILMMISGPIKKSIIDIQGPRRGPTARFVRYLGCAVIMCTDGCESDVVYTHALEYEGNKVVKSCHQFIEEKGWCEGKDPGTHLCGEDYVFEFTFDGDVKYRGDYSVNSLDPSTYGSCGYGDSGWQTDASCIGRWEESGYMDMPCITCKLNKIPYGPVPMGVLFSYGRGSECGISGNDLFAGSLYVSDEYANNNCETGGKGGSLKNCDFKKDNTFWIWTVENGQSAWCLEGEDKIFGKWKLCGCAGLEWYRCPKLAICEYAP